MHLVLDDNEDENDEFKRYRVRTEEENADTRIGEQSFSFFEGKWLLRYCTLTPGSSAELPRTLDSDEELLLDLLQTKFLRARSLILGSPPRSSECMGISPSDLSTSFFFIRESSLALSECLPVDLLRDT